MKSIFHIVNIYHFYTSDAFYTDVYYFTFVLPKMYQWQVRNDFNKDVYICITPVRCLVMSEFRLDNAKLVRANNQQTID